MPKIRLSMEWLVYPRLETALTLFHFRTRGGKEIEKHGGNFSAFVPYHLTLLLALLYLRKEHAISMSLFVSAAVLARAQESFRFPRR